MKTKVCILTAGIILFLALPTLTTAQQYRAMDKDRNYNNCLINDLTEDQQEKIDAIKAESFKTKALLRADVDIKEAELDKLLLANEPSKTAINSKIDEISLLKADIRKESMAKRIDIRDELTPEQKLVFDMHRGHQKHSMNGHSKGNKMHNNTNCTHHNGSNMQKNGDGRHMRMDYHNK